MNKATFVLLFAIFAQVFCSDFHCGQVEYSAEYVEWEPTPDNDERAANSPASQFTLTLNFQNTISQSQFADQRAQFQAAADVWMELLRPTSATVSLNVDVASLGGNTLGQASSRLLIVNFDSFVQTLGARNGNTYPLLSQFNANLQAGDSFVDSRILLPQAVARAVGLPNLGNTADGDITFSTDFNFDTDLSNGLTNGQSDFLAVAIHEFGHLLGFTSEVDRYDSGNQAGRLTPLDLHRFAPSAINFVTTERLLNPSVDPHRYFRGNRQGATPLQIGLLSRGRPTSGQQASHWLDDNSNPLNYFGIMDPVLTSGQINGLTPADDEAYRGLGYLVASPPCPIIYGVFNSIELGGNTPTVVTTANSGTTVVILGQMFRPGVMCRFGTQLVTATIPANTRHAQIQCTVGVQGANTVEVTNDGILFSNSLSLLTNGGAPLPAVCGNGALETPDEQCDDGDTQSGDGCSSACVVEVGFTCPPNMPCVPTCGDGRVVSDEDCDDGNLDDLDGCDSSCQVEPNFLCSGGNINTADTCTCQPVTTCAAEGFSCGVIDDGCNAAQSCGDCTTSGNPDAICQMGTETGGQCILPGCTPTTTCLAEGRDCGTLFDGCLEISCGTSCPGGQECSADGVCPAIDAGDQSQDSGSSSGPDIGLIVGIIVAVIVGLCILFVVVGLIAAYVYKKRQDVDDFQSSNPLYGGEMGSTISPVPIARSNTLDTYVPTAAPIPVKPMNEIHTGMSAPPVPQANKPAPPQANKPPVPQANKPPTPQANKPPMPQVNRGPVPQPKPTATRPPQALKPAGPRFKKNQMVKAKYSGDNQFYSAKVLNFDAPSNSYYVNYIEFGEDSEWVSAQNMQA